MTAILIKSKAAPIGHNGRSRKAVGPIGTRPLRRKPTARAQWVYMFSEGEAGMRDLLGGKGANLAEMTRLSLRVPPGFIVTTQACNAYHEILVRQIITVPKHSPGRMLDWAVFGKHARRAPAESVVAHA